MRGKNWGDAFLVTAELLSPERGEGCGLEMLQRPLMGYLGVGMACDVC